MPRLRRVVLHREMRAIVDQVAFHTESGKLRRIHFCECASTARGRAPRRRRSRGIIASETPEFGGRLVPSAASSSSSPVRRRRTGAEDSTSPPPPSSGRWGGGGSRSPPPTVRGPANPTFAAAASANSLPIDIDDPALLNVSSPEDRCPLPIPPTRSRAGRPRHRVVVAPTENGTGGSERDGPAGHPASDARPPPPPRARASSGRRKRSSTAGGACDGGGRYSTTAPVRPATPCFGGERRGGRRRWRVRGGGGGRVVHRPEGHTPETLYC